MFESSVPLIVHGKPLLDDTEGADLQGHSSQWEIGVNRLEAVHEALHRVLDAVCDERRKRCVSVGEPSSDRTRAETRASPRCPLARGAAALPWPRLEHSAPYRLAPAPATP